MNFKLDINQDSATLAVEGRLDTSTAPEFEQQYKALPETVQNLVVDLQGVTYVSSAGLRVLLGAQKKMNQIGTMKLIGVCESVMNVFEMTGFADIFEIE